MNWITDDTAQLLSAHFSLLLRADGATTGTAAAAAGPLAEVVAYLRREKETVEVRLRLKEHEASRAVADATHARKEAEEARAQVCVDAPPFPLCHGIISSYRTQSSPSPSLSLSLSVRGVAKSQPR